MAIDKMAELGKLIEGKIMEGLRNAGCSAGFEVKSYFASWDKSSRRLQIYINKDGDTVFDLPLTIRGDQFLDDYLTQIDASLHFLPSELESIFRAVFTGDFYNKLKDILRQFPGYEAG